MDYVLTTHNLTKKYKQHTVVDNINMSVKRGEIYGFLGQNGAGKTTTIRMIMGLIKPTTGSIELFGDKVSLGNRHYLERIGSIIEFPGFYPNLTAVENLDIHRRLMGVTNKNSIEEALHIVKLLDAANRKFKTFSLGMKQRLGIARALLHQPELLILDEPTNGLDPIGIKEIRQLILYLAQKRKITVLISSHILSEIEQLATTIGIIHKGKLMEELDLDKIQEKNRHYIELTVSNDQKTALLLEQKLAIEKYHIIEPGIVRVYEKLDESEKINRLLIQNNVDIRCSNVSKDTLEDYFVQLTGGEKNAG